MEKNDNFIKENSIIFKKYKIKKKLGEGAFGDVYVGSFIETNELVAIKVEQRKIAKPLLETEAFFLYSLRGFGIPEVISFGRMKNYNVLIEPLLDKSLFDIFNERRKKLPLADICLIGKQIIDRIQWVHSKNIVHRDIKPDNFLIGRNDPNVIYLIDFGLSKKFKSSTTGKHIRFGFTGKLTGTVRFASANALRGGEQSRKDDLESIGYMMIYFMRGKLPWQGVTGNKKIERYLKIYKMKKNVSPEDLCKSLPKQMVEFMRYVKSLEFEQEPDYNFLRNLFNSILKRINKSNEKLLFSWISLEDVQKLKNPVNPATRRDSPQSRLYRKIQNSLDKIRNASSDESGGHNSFQTSTITLNTNMRTINKNDSKDEINTDTEQNTRKIKSKEGLNTTIANLNKTLDTKLVEDFDDEEKLKPSSNDIGPFKLGGDNEINDDNIKNENKNYTMNERINKLNNQHKEELSSISTNKNKGNILNDKNEEKVEKLKNDEIKKEDIQPLKLDNIFDKNVNNNNNLIHNDNIIEDNNNMNKNGNNKKNNNIDKNLTNNENNTINNNINENKEKNKVKNKESNIKNSNISNFENQNNNYENNERIEINKINNNELVNDNNSNYKNDIENIKENNNTNQKEDKAKNNLINNKDSNNNKNIDNIVNKANDISNKEIIQIKNNKNNKIDNINNNNINIANQIPNNYSNKKNKNYNINNNYNYNDEKNFFNNNKMNNNYNNNKNFFEEINQINTNNNNINKNNNYNINDKKNNDKISQINNNNIYNNIINDIKNNKIEPNDGELDENFQEIANFNKNNILTKKLFNKNNNNFNTINLNITENMKKNIHMHKNYEQNPRENIPKNELNNTQIKDFPGNNTINKESYEKEFMNNVNDNNINENNSKKNNIKLMQKKNSHTDKTNNHLDRNNSLKNLKNFDDSIKKEENNINLRPKTFIKKSGKKIQINNLHKINNFHNNKNFDYIKKNTDFIKNVNIDNKTDLLPKNSDETEEIYNQAYLKNINPKTQINIRRINNINPNNMNQNLNNNYNGDLSRKLIRNNNISHKNRINSNSKYNRRERNTNNNNQSYNKTLQNLKNNINYNNDFYANNSEFNLNQNRNKNINNMNNNINLNINSIPKDNFNTNNFYNTGMAPNDNNINMDYMNSFQNNKSKNKRQNNNNNILNDQIMNKKNNQINMNINNNINNNIIINNNYNNNLYTPSNVEIKTDMNDNYQGINSTNYILNKIPSNNNTNNNINSLNNLNRMEINKRPSCNVKSKVNNNTYLNQINMNKRPSYNNNFNAPNFFNYKESYAPMEGRFTKIKKLNNIQNQNNTGIITNNEIRKNKLNVNNYINQNNITFDERQLMNNNLINIGNIQSPINNYNNLQFQTNLSKTPINSEEIFSMNLKQNKNMINMNNNYLLTDINNQKDRNISTEIKNQPNVFLQQYGNMNDNNFISSQNLFGNKTEFNNLQINNFKNYL